MVKFNVPVRVNFPDLRKVIVDTQPLSDIWYGSSYAQLFYDAMQDRIEMYRRSILSAETLYSSYGIDLDEEEIADLI